MAVVDYKVASSLEQAVEYLSSAEIPTRILAGGTDLIIQSKAQSTPVGVIDIKKVASMISATLDDSGLTLGPAMSCVEFTAREDIKAVYPGLVEAAYLIGSTQVQGRCSVGGNLCNASPAADTIPALIANSAICHILGPKGSREVAVENFVTGVGQNCMSSDEILASIKLPRPASGTSDAYLRFIPRTEMDIAVAGAGVSVSLDDTGKVTAARVAIGAVATTALLVPEAAAALIGSKLEEDALTAAAQAASTAAKPITDRRGTAEYRQHVVGVLVKRAAVIAANRVTGG